VLRGFGNAAYGQPEWITELDGSGLDPRLRPLGLGDLDGDGRADLIFAHGAVEIYYSVKP
jgi:hypothetical protein